MKCRDCDCILTDEEVVIKDDNGGYVDRCVTCHQQYLEDIYIDDEDSSKYIIF